MQIHIYHTGNKQAYTHTHTNLPFVSTLPALAWGEADNYYSPFFFILFGR